MIGTFSQEALDAVSEFFAEGQQNTLEGQCGQREKRKAMAKPRTPLQEQADRQRSQQQRGKSTQSSSVRSEAAKKSAETRRRCKGGGSTTRNTSGTTA